MKKKLQHLSVRTYMLFLLGAVIVLFLALLAFNTSMAGNLLLERIYYNTQDTAVLYEKQIDNELDRIETYLYTVAIDNPDYTNLLYQDPASTTWYNSLHRLGKEFSSALQIYTADGFLFYATDTDTFLFQNPNISQNLELRRLLRDRMAGQDISASWELLEAGGENFLFRCVKIGKARLGAAVSVNTLLGSVTNTNTDNVALYLTAQDNRLVGYGNAVIELDFEVQADSSTVKEINGEKMLVVWQPLADGELYLTRLVPYSEVQELNAALYRNIFLIIMLFFAACMALAFFMKRHIIRPVTALTKALEEVSEGDLENHISTSGQLKEYSQMSKSFNGMVSEIRNLKIDVYEEKILYQELENQYLKQQITPHFMINCLNTAYQLTEPETLELSRSMLMDLSRHLRYTLSSGQTVPLYEDLELVKNYVEMSSIRYPGCLALFMTCPDAFRQATVVPLLILNFIENTVKYEVVMGEVLEMHVDVTSYETEKGILLHVCIWDTGRGFSPKMLAKITDPSYPSSADSAHIGITNVLFRMRHIFPDAVFSFCNRQGAGAQIDIEFPYQPYAEV